MVTEILLLAIAVWSIFSAEGDTIMGLVYLLAAVGVYFYNILDAHLCIYRDYRDRIPEKIPRTQKNPWFAVCISRIIPGLGHLYADKSVLGLVLLTVSLILYGADDLYAPLLVITPLLSAIAAYHVYVNFPRKGRQPNRRSTIAILAGAIFCVGLFAAYLPQSIDNRVDRFTIPSDSMVPTLERGDRLFVDPSPNYRPKRGDIIVFRPHEAIVKLDPTAASEFYVKRAIGLPGETVAVRDGSVFINGRRLVEDYEAEIPTYGLEAQVVPPDSVFVLGDNRNDSFDSHLWGMLPQQQIVGRAYKIYWPPHRIQSLARPAGSMSHISL